MSESPPAHTPNSLIYWHLLANTFGQTDAIPSITAGTRELLDRLELPEAIVDPQMATETLIQRYPEVKPDFDRLDGRFGDEGEQIAEAPEMTDPETQREAFAVGKLLLSVFGPTSQTGTVTAQQYQQWKQDVQRLGRCFGPGSQTGGVAQGDVSGNQGTGGTEAGTEGSGGGGNAVFDADLKAGLEAIDKDLIQRMHLREVLKDDRMAAQLTPSMGLVEELLRDKGNLSGTALKNARELIRQYVDQLAEVLRLQVEKATKGKLDYSVPPKRVFRNLDLKRTLWKNLINYHPAEGRLYVDQLYYRHTARKTTPTRMIVVVDQSGSMVDAMVQCTILASIFAGLPNVDMHLLAFDTQTIDLTDYVADPFEVLMRTNLGGGTYILKALQTAAEKIEEPKNTALVLISDFYEGGSDQELLDEMIRLRNGGTHMIPVGAVTSGGYFSLNDFFRKRLKSEGMPVLSGSITKLIDELKAVL